MTSVLLYVKKNFATAKKKAATDACGKSQGG